ncbi:uncharacterized protein LOC141855620 isoform X2 [Brevipalpus obovatus]|uniref:uncharacterized protein LOC141855620 isoform X2 n=1 Tax=Brevipalpus obovatus TaxID=246614 RepID=UPI003D9FACAF
MIQSCSMMIQIYEKFQIASKWYEIVKNDLIGDRRRIGRKQFLVLTQNDRKRLCKPVEDTKLVRAFLQRDIRCLPKFVLIFTRPEYFSQINSIPYINYPMIIITNFTQSRWDRDFEPFKPFAAEICSTNFSCFAINRFSDDIKITITDWTTNDISSPSPDSNDPKYPIKFTIYFFYIENYWSLTEEELADIRKLDDHISYPDFPGFGGFISGTQSKPLFYDFKNSRFCPSEALSVTFAGQNIDTAFLEIFDKDGPEVVKKVLIKFRESLSFDPNRKDDLAYTLGFFVEYEPLLDGCKTKDFANTQDVAQLFPKIKFISLNFYRCSSDKSNPSYGLYLVHFFKSTE